MGSFLLTLQCQFLQWERSKKYWLTISETGEAQVVIHGYRVMRRSVAQSLPCRVHMSLNSFCAAEGWKNLRGADKYGHPVFEEYLWRLS